jgi:multidrug efflux system membrane fusion protein
MKRPSNSVLMATGLAVAVLAWMLSGIGREAAPASEPSAPPGGGAATTLPRVSVQQSRARALTREIVVSARTEPNRRVELRAETEGRVVALGAERGAAVRAGELIVALDLRDREARLEETRTLIAYAEQQFEAARELKAERFVSDTHLAELASRVASARAARESVELEIANTTIVAPFDAVLQDRLVELGDYVNAGDAVAELVDTDPLVVVGEVSERDVHELAIGKVGFARRLGGAPIEGRIRYLAPVADAGTRTFRVELAIANGGAELRAGMTAELRLAAEEITAHLLSPALLTLDDAGTVGVKSVNAHDRVEFHPVEIVGSSGDGLSVTGLPQEIRLITIGQGFVRAGDPVEPTLLLPSAGVRDGSNQRLGNAQAKR